MPRKNRWTSWIDQISKGFTKNKKWTTQRCLIAFYNVENLFDINDDHQTIDEEFTLAGGKEWTEQRLTHKLNKLGNAVRYMSEQTTGNMPVLLGLAEVENKKVLERLLNTNPFKDHTYGIIHFNSPDERGIDVALLYQTESFFVMHQEALPVHLTDEQGNIDTTRDILYVSGMLHNQQVHIMVLHWPSKREGDINKPKRMLAAQQVRDKIDRIFDQEQGANIIVMGDFNDNPSSDSVSVLNVSQEKMNLQARTLFNPMIKLHQQGKGSLVHKQDKELFDQFLFSRALINPKNRLTLEEVNVFDDYRLKEWHGRYQGNPYRTYVGKKYMGGYSDHFPVYAVLTL